ncbi:hypothetical protein [Luteimonas granuli]|uniref:Uncharacterized protein n=1 Tax=Luteimonas granuli TaxID=1176533 RepID=A0A518N1W4_9GAMM|nr:hypothetical protein [Luteimonas granuli]QDW65889.1 hypothetical protein FPZ22_02415 [Luteimonas granuli]
MAFTRAQATGLLNKTEMRLFDDSRANALRRLDRTALMARITRSRAARDRARDLLKRQRIAARKGGPAGRDGVADRTARKERLLVEILERFVDARRRAPAEAARATMPAAKKASGATAKKVSGPTVKKASTPKKAATMKSPARKTAARTAAGSAVPAKKAARRETRRAGKAMGTVTPEGALESTRRLLEAKQERDRSPRPWHSLGHAADPVPEPGYQSPQAASKAQELHAGESRMTPIHGSISTHDRHNQGKRDSRGDND